MIHLLGPTILLDIQSFFFIFWPINQLSKWLKYIFLILLKSIVKIFINQMISKDQEIMFLW